MFHSKLFIAVTLFVTTASYPMDSRDAELAITLSNDAQGLRALAIRLKQGEQNNQERGQDTGGHAVRAERKANKLEADAARRAAAGADRRRSTKALFQ